MKQIMFLIALAGMATTGFAQTEFKPLPFQQALSEARAGDKHVLVDCYTSWCAPCHKMTNEVFPLKTVGDYLNPRFVSVKYDIEKDEEGKRLARQHDVTLIPTFLIFRPDGSLLHKIVGAADAERFLRQVEESFDNDRAYGVLRELYASGRGDTAFLAACLKSFTALGDTDVEELCRRLVAQLSDEEKTRAEHWFIYASDKLSPAQSRNERFLMEHHERFRENVGAPEVNKELYRRYKRRLLEIARGKEEISLSDLRKLTSRIGKSRLNEGKELKGYGHIAAEVIKGDLGRLITVCARDLPGLPDALSRYFELSDRVIAQGNPQQKQQWLALGETIWNASPAEQKSRMEAFMKYVRDKTMAPPPGE